MPQFDKFLIAPINTGLQTNLRPFLILDDAFTKLQNAYVYRGRLRKRFGSLFMGANQYDSRLRINIGTTNSMTGNFSGTVPGNIFEIGQTFSVGTQIFTVYQTGTPGNMLSTGAATGTYNTSTGAVVITGAAVSTAVFFYPGSPVMGITQYESGAINNHPSYAFDTQFAYVFSGGAWSRSGSGTSPLWHDPSGNQINYFWATNWEGSSSLAATTSPVMFVTNFQVTNPDGVIAASDDPIWYTPDGSTWTAAKFYFKPTGSPASGPYVVTSRIIVPFKNRLILLNTIESDGTDNFNYVNRCRYSWNGSPLATQAWYEPNTTDGTNIAAGAGFIDAYTEEQIVSAQFIKDRLIVYFERSTWELVYTQNEVLPFVWQKLNTELGSQGTFSTIPHDRYVTTIGQSGIHACNGSNVERIDSKIPQEIFDAFATKNNAPLRIAGIRDYFTELDFWSFLNTSAVNQNFPNQILVYNYQNDSWALNDDCFTAYGYFEQQSDMTWASSSPLTWQQFTASWIDNIVQANQRQIIAGTPEGFVLRIAADIPRNAPAMQITNMTIPSVVQPEAGYVDMLVIEHNLAVGDFVAIENTNGINLPITGFYQVYFVTDTNNFTIYAPDVSGTYLGGGTLARVSNIQFNTKQFNPYGKEDKNLYLEKVDFYVEKTDNGQITVDYYPSASETSMLEAGEATQSIMGTGILETFPYDPTLYPFEQQQERLQHPVYFQTVGNCIQLAFFLSYNQLSNGNIAWSDFQLDGLCLYTCRSGRMQ